MSLLLVVAISHNYHWHNGHYPRKVRQKKANFSTPHNTPTQYQHGCCYISVYNAVVIFLTIGVITKGTFTLPIDMAHTTSKKALQENSTLPLSQQKTFFLLNE